MPERRPTYRALKRVVVGSPIATSDEHHTRLWKEVVTSVPIHIGEPAT